MKPVTDLKLARWIKENVEAIAIAVVMALVIRQFAVEAFKIPTESMWPTLNGDSNGGGTGDRILVYKIPYIFGEPDRWDVVVFKFPLNESKNYIKRLVGLPGESLTISRDGDIIIDGEVIRKPPHVQEVLFFPVNTGRPGAVNTGRPGAGSTNWKASADHWSRTEDGVWSVDSPDDESLNYYGQHIKSMSGGMDRASDVRIRLEATPESEGEIILLIREHGVDNRLVLAVGAGESSVGRGLDRFPLEGLNLTPGESVDITFTNVDDTLAGEVDGHEFRHELPSITVDAERRNRHKVAFGVRSAKATFEDVRLDRDIVYSRQGRHRDVEIPPDHFFMLGDNSSSSKDSRRWELNVRELSDGTVIKCDAGSPDAEDRRFMPDRRPGTKVILDNFGIWRVIPSGSIESEKTVSAPFVRRSQLIGKAFFVFWPLGLFETQFRLKFIR